MRHKTKVAAIAAAAVIAVSGIAATAWAVSGHHSPAATHARTIQAAAPAGCERARLIAAGVSSNLRANPAGTSVALSQLRDLGRSLPSGQLKSDVLQAVVDLAFFREYMAMGGPAAQAARNFGADLARIRADCA